MKEEIEEKKPKLEVLRMEVVLLNGVVIPIRRSMVPGKEVTGMEVKIASLFLFLLAGLVVSQCLAEVSSGLL